MLLEVKDVNTEFKKSQISISHTQIKLISNSSQLLSFHFPWAARPNAAIITDASIWGEQSPATCCDTCKINTAQLHTDREEGEHGALLKWPSRKHRSKFLFNQNKEETTESRLSESFSLTEPMQLTAVVLPNSTKTPGSFSEHQSPDPQNRGVLDGFPRRFDNNS